MASLASVPGLAESALEPGDLAALPSSSPPAPWSARARALMWLQRAPAPAFDWAGSPLPLSMVILVDYLETPVGPYQEVLTGQLVRRGPWLYAQVPFIAVDSLASVHGGRANWGLPKTMATFTGSALSGRVAVASAGWSVDVSPLSAVRAPRVPLISAFSCIGPLGRYRTTMRARVSPVAVAAEVSGPTLTPWLGSGRRRAFVLEGRMDIAAPAPL
jgi:acetoacetate decarboxylase